MMQTSITGFKQEIANRDKVNNLFFALDDIYTWNWDENEERIPLKLDVTLSAATKPNKKGKLQFLLLRMFKYSDDIYDVEDEVVCKSLEELLQLFENEKEEWEYFKEQGQKGILFDGHRYMWNTKIEDGNVIFLEKTI